MKLKRIIEETLEDYFIKKNYKLVGITFIFLIIFMLLINLNILTSSIINCVVLILLMCFVKYSNNKNKMILYQRLYDVNILEVVDVEKIENPIFYNKKRYYYQIKYKLVKHINGNSDDETEWLIPQNSNSIEDVFKVKPYELKGINNLDELKNIKHLKEIVYKNKVICYL